MKMQMKKKTKTEVAANSVRQALCSFMKGHVVPTELKLRYIISPVLRPEAAGST